MTAKTFANLKNDIGRLTTPVEAMQPENVQDILDTIEEKSYIVLTGRLVDVSTAGQIYLACPVAGELIACYTVLNGAIATADAIITVKTPAGTVGTITVATAASAAGIVDSLTTGLANTTLAAGGTVEFETGGQSTNTIPLDCTALVRVA